MPDLNLSARKFANFYTFFILIFAVTLFAGQYFIPRTNFVSLVCWQLILHIVFAIFYFCKEFISLQKIFFAAVIFRVGLAWILPSLSDDVYRFIWDGHLIVNGQNPLLSTPDNYLSAINNFTPDYTYLHQLHGLINHPQFYTCYPPLMQVVFAVAAFIGGNSIFVSIIIIKIIVALSDCVAIYFIAKILKKINADAKLVLLYALNPLVIVEGAGNGHFEVVQVALMVMSIYYILQNKYKMSALLFGFAIVTKLLPLLVLPLIIRLLGLKKGFQFSIISIAVGLILFIPFIASGSLDGFATSLNLYFQNFEFNASIYYVAREIGWWFKGYNYISFIGPFLMVIFLSIYGVIFLKKKYLSIEQYGLYTLIVLSLYYFFATTVHPWYIINLLPFALIANKKYAFVWMGIAFLSYNAYTNVNFKENFYLIALEYLIVAIAILFSFKKRKFISH